MFLIACNDSLDNEMLEIYNKDVGVTIENKNVSNHKSLTETGSYPVVKKGETVSVNVFAPLRSGVTSYNVLENDHSKWLNEKTGIDFSYLEIPSDNRAEHLNELMENGTYPDVLLNSFFSSSELTLYGKRGDLLPLNNLIDLYAPNIKQILEENPHILKELIMENGNIYSVPSVGGNIHLSVPFKMWINETWLDNLGLAMPTTIEDFKEVLIAFRDGDPNGNGLRDEIPLTGSLFGWNTDPTVFIANAFGYFEPSKSKGFRVLDGNVLYVKETEGYKQTLDFMSELYLEGLLDNSFLTRSSDDLKKLNGSLVSRIGMCAGGSISSFLTVGETDIWKEYVAIPPLEAVDGEGGYAAAQDTHYISALNITSKCENPEAVIRAFDLMFTEEGLISNAFGIKDTDWVYSTEDELNYEGDPATYTFLTNFSERGNRVWNQLGPTYRSPEYDLLFVADLESVETLLYNETVTKYLPEKVYRNMMLPSLAFTENETKLVVSIETSLEENNDLFFEEVIKGVKNTDEHWNDYIEKLKELGVDTLTEIYQGSYDVYNAN